MNEPAEFPENACSYEHYDPETLQASNIDTHVRIAELGWTEADFKGRTVLDIGMNTGLLSIKALELGATHVTSVDVQKPLVDFFTSVVARHKLAATVGRRGVQDLSPEKDAADIVLFMEVLHWTTAQGQPILDTLSRVSELTNQTLYLEFPWSVKEPSIAVQTKLTEDDYSSDLILDCLSRLFEEVQIVRFMHYFGYGSKSRRVLVKASKKRIDAPFLSRVPQVDPLDSLIHHASNRASIANSAYGPVILKTSARNSNLSIQDGALIEKLFDKLNADSAKQIFVLPIKLADGYFVEGAEASRVFMFPLLNTGTDGPFKPSHRALGPDDIIAIASAIYDQVKPISSGIFTGGLARELAKAGFQKPGLHALKIAKSNLENLDNLKDEDRDAISAILDEAHAMDQRQLDTLAHGDLQSGNVIAVGENAMYRLVDLDNFFLATAYIDGIMGLVWSAAEPDHFEKLGANISARGYRKIAARDFGLAIALLLSWTRSFGEATQGQLKGRQIEKFEIGLSSALEFVKTRF